MFFHVFLIVFLFIQCRTWAHCGRCQWNTSGLFPSGQAWAKLATDSWECLSTENEFEKQRGGAAHSNLVPISSPCGQTNCVIITLGSTHDFPVLSNFHNNIPTSCLTQNRTKYYRECFRESLQTPKKLIQTLHTRLSQSSQEVKIIQFHTLTYALNT